MVVALFALSLVMILGGIASVVQGFPFVRLESGLAMVIGGSTAASAGFILLGLAAVVMRLKRLEGVFASLRAAEPGAFDLPRDVGPPPVSTGPALAGTAGLAGVSLGGGLAGEWRESEPAFDSPAPRLDPADRFVPQGSAVEIEPPLPDLLPADEPAAIVPARQPDVAPDKAKAISPEPISPEEDLFASPRLGEIDAGAPEPPQLRPSLDDPPIAEDVAAPEPKQAETAPPEDRQVVGTHTSGEDTYVMFADGSIEAHTPRGPFSFGSLDELRAWKAGETTKRAGAA